ncbi:hypothetical protein EON63_13830 [archaeon]|nr:MAG: hypothetical protein EON63_13830 [archaeon]
MNKIYICIHIHHTHNNFYHKPTLLTTTKDDYTYIHLEEHYVLAATGGSGRHVCACPRPLCTPSPPVDAEPIVCM